MFQDYVILYTSDTSLALSKWNRIPAKCRDSFGKVIDQLSTDSDYKVCVITNSSFVKNNAIVGDENCDTIKLNEGKTDKNYAKKNDQFCRKHAAARL